MSPNSPFEEPSEVGMAHHGDADDLATRETAQRTKIIRLAILGLVAGTSLGYMAVSLRNGDLSWLKNLGSGAASEP
ncbi:hypothetical protein [Novosphingobium sp.]|uniref:hypothetical protein n=1 Tax=Novosphingobium sp. TaxID=1874826 RepID=UPI00286C0485|nr:hypothetical protein [Novosphingobium sp.]